MELDDWFDEWIRVDNDSTFDEFCENKRNRGYIGAVIPRNYGIFVESYNTLYAPGLHKSLQDAKSNGLAFRNSTNTGNNL